MPFADKFRAMMNFPLPGDTVGAFLVESVDVGHESGGPGIYKYAVRLVLRGPGGRPTKQVPSLAYARTAPTIRPQATALRNTWLAKSRWSSASVWVRGGMV